MLLLRHSQGRSLPECGRPLQYRVSVDIVSGGVDGSLAVLSDGQSEWTSFPGGCCSQASGESSPPVSRTAPSAAKTARPMA